MNSRSYNKLYLPKNREEGSEKIAVGYQSNLSEIQFKKDRETYFHVPTYTSVINLTASSLIEDGAVGGLFPAASDRIYQSRKNYGVNTNNGPMLSSVADGMWFCSWLYRAPDGSQQWYDRFYDPGKFSSSVSIQGLLYPTYTSHDPIFEDVPSSLTLSPGVLYRYYHVGEQTASDLVETFNESNGTNFSVFNLTQWGVSAVDTSLNGFTVVVNSEAKNSELYPDLKDPQRVDKKLISFNHNHDAECYISWNDNLNLSNEFTLSFWTRSDDWKNSPTTQLAGNYSSKGGFGVFIDSLSSFPLFVIPETYYGHTLIVNEDGVGVTDKLTRIGICQQASPKFVCVNTDNDIIICHNDDTGTIYKINHLGTVLQSTKSGTLTGGFGFEPAEVPLGLLCTKNNDIWAVTNKKVYKFDTNLILKSQIFRTTLSTEVFAISSNSTTNEYDLVFDVNSVDIKFVEQTKWTINKTDFNLYRNDVLFFDFDSSASTFQIDPLGRLWVLHGNNDISIINPAVADETQKLVQKIDIGTNTVHYSKYISFMQTYDRTTQTFEWVAVVHYSDENVLYMIGLDGILRKTTNLNNLYRNKILKELGQDPMKFEYLGKGDFTGYEQRRVFKNITPYSNKQQLIFKASLRDYGKTANDYSVFTCQCPIDTWDNKSWQHVVVTYQNKQFALHVNGILKASVPHSGRYGLSFEQQPSWFFGTPVGYKNGFNKETGHPSLIFNGYLQTIKLYSRCLNQSEIFLLLQSNIVGEDIFWSLATPKMQYVEKIERVFKHKLPGSKSPFYKIKLANFPVEDPVIKTMIQEEITKIVEELNPGYVDFVDVQWL
jgi:hypothetical protein